MGAKAAAKTQLKFHLNILLVQFPLIKFIFLF